MIKRFFQLVLVLITITLAGIAVLVVRGVYTVDTSESDILGLRVTFAVLNRVQGEIAEQTDNVKDKLGMKDEQNEEVKRNITLKKPIKGWYYDQLPSGAKMVYHAIENNREEMKTGTHTIELGGEFSDLLNKNEGSERLGNYFQSALEAYVYDNPDLFYLDLNKLYLNVETTTQGDYVTYRVFLANREGETYLTDGLSNEQEVDSIQWQLEMARTEILENAGDDTYENIRMIHDYLVDSIDYDTSLTDDSIYTIRGALLNKRAVCEGYAKAFKYLADELDIPCVIVSGISPNADGVPEDHAWNCVYMNAAWYAVDVTWDDPVIIGNGTLDDWTKWSYQHKYLMLGSESFYENHTPDGKLSKNGMTFDYPVLSEYDFD